MHPSGRAVWDDLTPRDDLAALDPGPGPLPAAPDVLVVGGGQIGLAVGAMCVRAGLGEVLVVERDRLAAGPSGRNAGFLTPGGHSEYGEAWEALGHRALDLHRELDAAWGYGVRDLDMVRESDVHGDPDEVHERQGHVNPLRVAAALARNAGTVLSRVEVTSAETGGGRVVRVRTSAGDIAPGAVVFATGSVPEQAGPCPQSLVKGHLIATEPAPFELGRMIVADDVGIVQLEDGRLLCGGTLDAGDDTEGVMEPPVAALRATLARCVPEAGRLGIAHRWCCFRPLVADELPVVDRLPDVSNAWCVGGLYRTGLLMAPLVGAAVASWIASGDGARAPDDAAAFALRRPALAG